jgi:hypothetical protein
MDELQNHRGIFYINRGVADWRFQGQEGALVVRATVALRVNNGDMMRDAAVAGLGHRLAADLHRRARRSSRVPYGDRLGPTGGSRVHLCGAPRGPACIGQAAGIC